MFPSRLALACAGPATRSLTADRGRLSGVRLAALAIAAVVATAVAAAVVPASLPIGTAAPFAGSSTTAAAVDPALANATGTVHVIVQTTGAQSASRAAVARLGGTVTRDLSIVHGYVATLPASAIEELAATAGVRALTLDRKMHVQASAPSTNTNLTPLASVHRQIVGSDRLNAHGADGSGVTVALIDTGVANLPDLAGRIVQVKKDPVGFTTSPCVNFSSETNCNDSFGHGTFIAGLIAGNGSASSGAYAGSAPNAKILSIKLSGADGSADVSQVLAAIQWVVSFRNVYGIKVLNLSLGTDSTQSYRVDPLNYAVEQAWKAGIAVVVAASNRGPGAGTISKPGDDPFVITVGATDDNGTTDLTDDAIPTFSSQGPTAADGLAKPDIVAPGSHLISLAAPGSTINSAYPSPMTAPYRRGSGTSFASGVVSGLVANMLSHIPMSPDRVKFALMSTARAYPGANPMTAGVGVPDGYAAAHSAPPGLANGATPPSNGSGSVEESRGSVHLASNIGGASVVIDGEVTVANTPFNVLEFLGLWTPTSWLGSNWTGSNWTGSNWTGSNWTGSNWTGSNWTGSNWTGSNWTGTTWTGSNWTGSNWTGSNWTGSNWTGSNWTGSNWTGSNWTGSNWTGSSWYGSNWTGSAWYGAWDQ